MIPQPLTVATNWGVSAITPLVLLFAALVAAFIYYWRLVRRFDTASLTNAALRITMLAIAGLLVAWCSPVLFSSDVYAYAAYGELARIGLSPYAPIPHGLNEPLVRAAQLQWITAFPVCVYGPLFAALAHTVVAAFATFGTLVQLNAFRVIACLSLLLCIPLAIAAYEGDRATRTRAALIIALNPVAIWCAAEGHNDALALAVALLGFAVSRALSIPLGTTIVAVSALVKAPAAAAVVAMGWIDRRSRITAAVSLAAVIALSWPLIAAVATHVSAGGRYAPQASLQAIVAPLGEAPALGVATLFAAVLAAHAVSSLRAGAVEGWIWFGLAAWALIPNPYPWYGIWLLAVVALAPASRAGAAGIALTLTSLLRYVPDAVGTPSVAGSVALGALASLPFLLTLGPRTARR